MAEPTAPVLVVAGPAQIAFSWEVPGVHDEGAAAALEFETEVAPAPPSGGAAGGHAWAPAPWNGGMAMQPPIVEGQARWSSGPGSPDGAAATRPLVPRWSSIVEGLAPSRGYVLRVRVRPEGGWSAPSDVIETLAPVDATAPTWSAADGSAAVGGVSSTAARGAGGMDNAEELLANLRAVTADDDSQPPPGTVRAVLEVIVFSEADGDGKMAELAGQWLADSLAADPGAAFKAKVKTLHFLMEVLARRWGVTLFRQAVRRHGERTLTELTTFSCAEDPTHGSKPSEWVQVAAKRTLQMIQDRLVDVSPKGEIKIAARKKHVSKIELRCHQRVRWAFQLAAREIAFCVRLSVEMNNGWETSVVIVEPMMLSAAGGPATGEYVAGDAFKRCLVTFEWDNTASKLSARNISYRLDVSCVPPDKAALGGQTAGAAQLPEGTPPQIRLPAEGGESAAGGGGGGWASDEAPGPAVGVQALRRGVLLSPQPQPRREQSPARQAAAGLTLQQQLLADARRAWVQDWIPKWRREGDGKGGAAIKGSERNGRRVRSLLQSGVPAALRATVWGLAVGNALEINREQFDIMVATAKATVDVTAEENGRVALSHGMIATDLNRTVGMVGFERFVAEPDDDAGGQGGGEGGGGEGGEGGEGGSESGSEEGQGHDYVLALQAVLGAFMHFKPSFVYTQGLSFVVATLLIHTAKAPPVVYGALGVAEGEEERDEDEATLGPSAEPDPFTAFTLMANLLEGSVLMTLFALDGEQMAVMFSFFDELFAAALPALHQHFTTHDIRPQLYLVEWVFTLFSKCLPPAVTGWIWDHICVLGESYVFCAALGLLKEMEPQLLLLEDITLVTLLKDVVRARMQCEGGHTEAEYVTGSVEFWGSYYKAMDAVKIGPRTWARFRDALAAAKPSPDAAQDSGQVSHAQPLAVTDSADVAEIDKMAAFAQTGRKGRRNAVPDAGCKVVDGVLTFD